MIVLIIVSGTREKKEIYEKNQKGEEIRTCVMLYFFYLCPLRLPHSPCMSLFLATQPFQTTLNNFILSYITWIIPPSKVSTSMVKCEQCQVEGATMQCPTCKKLNLPPSYFCAQECFKSAWPQHKLKHSAPTLVPTMTSFAQSLFTFTGELRPGKMTARRTVPAHIPRPDYISAKNKTGESVLEERSYSSNKIPVWKKAEEIEGIRRAARAAREILNIACEAAKPGISHDEIDRIVHEATLERNCYPSPLGYNLFPKSVCTSVNEVVCHGIPDTRELQSGDILNIDVSCFGPGLGEGVTSASVGSGNAYFHGDTNDTIFIGKPEGIPADIVSDFDLDKVFPDSKLTAAELQTGWTGYHDVKLLHAGYEAMMAGWSCVRPGGLYRYIGNAIQARATADNYGVIQSVCGHGIGALFHCAPQVPHYANSKATGVMKVGHVFTIEPMLTASGTAEDVLWPDDWTIATADGSTCSMFEHMRLVTETGYALLTVIPGEPHVPFYQKQLSNWGIGIPYRSSQKPQAQTEIEVDTEAAAQEKS